MTTQAAGIDAAVEARMKPLAEQPISVDAADNFARQRVGLIAFPDGLHPDSKHLVQSFAEAIARKLRDAEENYGYTNGWLTQEWREEAQQHLLDHLAKGDPRDVAVYAAFLWARGWPTLPFFQGAGVPAGWKLVPVEPTREMYDAGGRAINKERHRLRSEGGSEQYGDTLAILGYRAMLSASPPPSVPGGWRGIDTVTEKPESDQSQRSQTSTKGE